MENTDAPAPLEGYFKTAYTALCLAKDDIQTAALNTEVPVEGEPRTNGHASSLEQVTSIKDVLTEIEGLLTTEPPQSVENQQETKVEEPSPSNVENVDPAPNAAGVEGKRLSHISTSALCFAPCSLTGAARERLVEVPVRKRTGLVEEANPLLGGGGNRTFTLTLPATPFAPLDAAHQQQQPQTLQKPTPAAVAGGGPPTTTPVAAEVLATLGLAAPSTEQAAQNQQAAALFQSMGAFYSGGMHPIMPMATTDMSLSDRKPCNCKRSQCLKLYCDCFSAGGFCGPSCTCVSCCNTEQDLRFVQHARKIIMSKDPLAFHTKVSAMAGHKRGCKCKRSKCLKKYCECFSAGAKCNPEICQCEGCKNCDSGSGGPSRENPNMFAGFPTPYVLPGGQVAAAYMFADPNPAEPPTTHAAALQRKQQQEMYYAELQAMNGGGEEEGGNNNPTAVLGFMAETMNVQQQQRQQVQQEESQESEPASALVSHLSGDNDDGADTGASPAPHVIAARAALMAERKNRVGTMTAGAKRAGVRPPLPGNVRVAALNNLQMPLATASAGDAVGSDGGARSKRPKRAASGGVMGAVAAEAANWGPEFVSPPMKKGPGGAMHQQRYHPPMATAATLNQQGESPGPVTLRRNAMLRDALQGATRVTPVKGPEENEAASALIGLLGM